MRRLGTRGLSILLGGLVTACPLPGALGAQDIRRFERLGARDGLPQYTVYGIVQDDAGFIWLATGGGLSRFDGVTFQNFLPEPADPLSLPDRFIRALLPASDGSLWIGTDGRGLARWDVQSQGFVRVPAGDAAAPNADEPSLTDQIWAIAERPDGGLLLATGAGPRALDPGAGGWQRVTYGPDGPVQERCRAAERGLADTVLVGCADGSILRLVEDPPEGPREVYRSAAPGEVLSLLQVSTDSLLVGTDRGLFIASGQEPARELHLPPQASRQGSSPEVFELTKDRLGTLWVGTRLGLVEMDGRRTTAHISHADDLTSLSHSYVTRVFEDDRGGLWVGTWSGLNRLSPHRAAVHRLPIARGERGGLPGRGVIAITGDARGFLHVGAIGGYLSKFAPSMALGSAVDWTSSVRAVGSGHDVYGLVVTDELTWVGTAGSGLVSVADNRPESPPLRTAQLRTEELDVVALHRDQDGTLWVGTIEGGLYVVPPGATSLQRPRMTSGDGVQLEGYVWPIRSDSTGNVWFGTVGAEGGLHRVAASDGSIWSLAFNPDQPGGLSSGTILTLLPDPDGTVWVGTQGGGLNHVWPETGRVEILTTADGLPHDHVEGLLIDDFGYLWISTNDGLARLDRSSGDLRVFREGVGLQDRVFHANSAYKAPDGTLWFGGPGGLTVIDPSRLPPPSAPPPVALTRFAVFDKAQPKERWADLDRQLVLDPDENFFSFEFAALDFVSPEYNRYRYKLEGLDPVWTDGGNEGRANYTTVPPDDYVFVVSAANSEGVWNERALEILIRVLPPFYETWWFRTLVAALALGFLWALYAYRMHQLARVSAMRVRIAGRLHNEIGANLSSIRAQSARASVAAGRGDPLVGERIGRLAEDTIHKVREMLWVVKEEHDTVGGLVAQIENATDRLLAGIVPYEFVAATTPDPELRVPMELREDLYSMLFEVLQNVVKHAEADEVRVEVDFDAGDLVVSVTDDGRGFDAGRVREGEGLGLLRGAFGNRRLDYTVESAPGMGTSSSIRVRL